MKNQLTSTRRQFVKMGAATAVAIPLLASTSRSFSATNAAMRSAMKYQDKPEGEKSCAGCSQFIPGKTAASLGGCKLFPGDTEVSPKGFCVAWTAKPK